MADSDKNIRITTNKNKATLPPSIVFTGSSAGTSVLTLEVRDDNSIAFTGTDGDVFSLDYNLSTGTIWSVNDKSGTPLLRASAGGTIGIAELGTGVIVGIGQTNPKYKLDVQGWVGFASTGDGSYTVLVENGLTTGNNALSLRAANALRFYNSGNTLYTGFIGAQSGVNTTYTLPTTSPATGASVLQSTSGGVLSWVPMVAGSSSGAGSGTVAIPGAQYQVAAYYWSATGASVSGSSTFTNNTSTGVVDINHTTESTSISTGALVVDGGAGIAKSLFVGTTLSVGQVPGYIVPNNLATFVSTVNSYNQLVIQNKSNGTSASANLVVNNDVSSDSANYGEIGMNSSTFSGSGALNAAGAVYLAAHTAPLVLGTVTAHPIRFTVNNGATDMMYISESGTAISVFANLGLRSASDLRFWNSGNTQYAGLQGGNTATSYLLTLPTAQVGNGYSTIVVDSSGNMYFVPITGGLAATTATGNRPAFRYKQHHHVWFCGGYTPAVAGADTVIFRVPDSSNDGLTDITFILKEFDIRVETPSASPSRIQVEKSSTLTGAFTLAATGSSLIAGLGLTISGAGIYVTSTNTFPAGILVTSNDLLRLNWTLLNATHANFSVQLTLEEI